MLKDETFFTSPVSVPDTRDLLADSNAPPTVAEWRGENQKPSTLLAVVRDTLLWLPRNSLWGAFLAAIWLLFLVKFVLIAPTRGFSFTAWLMLTMLPLLGVTLSIQLKMLGGRDRMARRRCRELVDPEGDTQMYLVAVIVGTLCVPVLAHAKSIEFALLLSTDGHAKMLRPS